MIISKTIKIETKLPITNDEIENCFKELNLDVLRWAIINVDNDCLTLNISCNV